MAATEPQLQPKLHTQNRCKSFLGLTFSRMTSARLHSGSASLYLPRFPYRTARLFSVAATYSAHTQISMFLTSRTIQNDK